MRHWTKLDVINAYKDRFNSDEWLDYGKILGGFIITKNKSNRLISEWYYTSLFHPEYFVDSLGGEDNHPDFAEHRHDQVILGILAYSNNNGVKILEEEVDRPCKNAAVSAWRLKDDKFKMSAFYKTRLIKKIKKLIGSRLYNILHLRW